MVLDKLDLLIPPYKGSKFKVGNNVCAAGYFFLFQGEQTALDYYMKGQLNAQKQTSNWTSIPNTIPPALLTYQQNYTSANLAAVDKEINSLDFQLSPGQYLYHGGNLFPPGVTQITTTRPLSTSFSPVVAFLEAVNLSKAYNAGVINIYAIKVVNNSFKVFYFPPVTPLAHEDEVLFASGVCLRVVNNHSIAPKHVGLWPVGNSSGNMKNVPVNVIEVETI